MLGVDRLPPTIAKLGFECVRKTIQHHTNTNQPTNTHSNKRSSSLYLHSLAHSLAILLELIH